MVDLPLLFVFWARHNVIYSRQRQLRRPATRTLQSCIFHQGMMLLLMQACAAVAAAVTLALCSGDTRSTQRVRDPN